MNLKKILITLSTFLICSWHQISFATLLIPMFVATENGKGYDLGVIEANDTTYGVIFTPKLRDLPPGVHGFHVHSMPCCANYAKAAGGHLDPNLTDKHKGPYRGSGHLGDLPVLIVDQKGRAWLPLLAPRLKLADIEGHSLVIQEGGDNYSDVPMKHNNSQVRIACGVVPYY